MRNWFVLSALILTVAPVAAQTPAPAQPASATAASANDYTDEKNWLCRPGRQDACAVDLAATIVSADGSLTPEPWTAEPNPPIDCFYVYPTISTDQSPNSDMNADPAELNVIRQQFARFASVCKPYAPLYRQITLLGLRSVLNGPLVDALGRGLGYDDVRDAWNTYLKRDNKGRGVVLVGHSQGAMVLTSLIRNEIEGKPIQSQLVSAVLLGTTVLVPRGRDVGGSFNDVPLCRVDSQVGCVITYASFRSTVAPGANALFGKPGADGMTAACTNPAALEGGTGSLHAYLSTAGRTIVAGTPAPKEWVTGKTVDTPWVSVPGLLSARCTTNDNASYLEITVNSNPEDPRIDTLTGDLGSSPAIQGMWGLHLIDVNLGMGNLLEIVSQQSRAYSSRNRR